MKLKKVGKGLSVSSGYVTGKAFVVNKKDDLEKMKDGEIIILPYSSPNYAIAVMKSTAVICENGGKLSHICIVAMEMGIPCITQVDGITSKVKSGQVIHVDATKGEVYIDE